MTRACARLGAAAVVAVAALLSPIAEDLIPATAGVIGQPIVVGVPTGAAQPTGVGPTGVGGSTLDGYGELVAPVGGYFGPTSVWKTSVVGAPVNPDSAAMTANLAGQVARYYGGTAAFNIWQSNESLISAPAGTPTTRVIFDDCQHKGHVPAQLYGPGGIFLGVPIPAGAVPASGTDAGMAVYSPSTDQLWSFWKVRHLADGWHACWGGRIDHASTSPGWFPNGGGATATGLSSEGGAVTIRDVESGVIDHVMSLAIPDPAAYSNLSWPAQRSDGSVGSTSDIPEGIRFRIDPSIDLSRLKLTPIARMIAVAAQTYGFIVSDKAGAVSVISESGNAVQAATGTNPWGALTGGTKSYLILKNFPWSKLQALPTDWGKPAASPVAPLTPVVAPSPVPSPSASPAVAAAPTVTGAPSVPSVPAVPSVPTPGPALTVAAAGPVITGISPKTGPVAGGTRVTVTGNHLTGAIAITVGGRAASTVSCVTSSTCTIVTPAGTTGPRAMAVTTAAGTSVPAAAGVFTYGA